MKARELFDAVRSQKRNPFSLRLRLMLLVSAELLVCVLVAVGLYILLEDMIPLNPTVLLLLSLVVISLIIGMVITNFLSKIIFAPIRRLGKAMEQVADGDFTVRAPEQSSSLELMELYSGFNLMVQELGSTEILQTDFVSNVSHEFKTPINAIEGYSMLLQSGDNLTPQQREYVDKIVFNTQRLSSLMGSILLLSKLENQQIPTGQTVFRLDEQIRQSIVALEETWERKNIEIDADLAWVEYLGNEPMLRHVWDNLIGNAVKFSPEQSLVKIGLQKTDNGIRFTVEDQGPGIPEESQKRIFDKFYQSDSSHKQEGNGLGLALAKRIVTFEGGTITVENIPEGGCRFTVTLQ